MNQKINDKCSVHKNQINSLIDNFNIKCVNSEHYERHKISRNFVINIIIVNNIKMIKKISDNICKINVIVKKRTKIIKRKMNENLRKTVVDKTRVLRRNDTIDDKSVLRKINVFHENHKKYFIAIKYSSFDCYWLTDVFSFHSAETETETADAAERREPTLAVLSRDPVLQMKVTRRISYLQRFYHKWERMMNFSSWSSFQKISSWSNVTTKFMTKNCWR
jgi:hypothetical protein